MRKIFNTLEETTQKPCLEEKKAAKLAEDAYIAFQVIFLKLKNDNELENNRLATIRELLESHKTAKENIPKLRVIYLQQFNDLNIFPDPPQPIQDAERRSGLNAIEFKINRLPIMEEISNSSIRELETYIANLEAEIAKNKIEINKQSAQDAILSEKVNTANQAVFDCLNSPLSIRLNLKTLCKQIKQKIKIINQKRISINLKLLDLKYGLNSLKILNINKDFFDKNIKNIKELIVKLDELNTNPFDSSFFDVYKKAQKDLASYKEKRKMLKSKIKILEDKIKTIPDKKNNSKAKISNLFKKFKNC